MRGPRGTRDQGLTVVGVHTPEFAFEHDPDNVGARTRDLGVEYPVALDSDYGVWKAFANHYWPAVYLADATGESGYHHFGEGEYAETEMVIQRLLREAGAPDAEQDLVMVDPRGLEVAADWRTLGSPESYSGTARARASRPRVRKLRPTARLLAAPRLRLNAWDLSGQLDARPACGDPEPSPAVGSPSNSAPGTSTS